MKVKVGNRNKFITLESVELHEVGDKFLLDEEYIKSLYLPNLKIADGFFLNENVNLEVLYVPNLEKTGPWFLFSNMELKLFEFPKLKDPGYGSFQFHPNKKKYMISLNIIIDVKIKLNESNRTREIENITKIKINLL